MIPRRCTALCRFAVKLLLINTVLLLALSASTAVTDLSNALPGFPQPLSARHVVGGEPRLRRTLSPDPTDVPGDDVVSFNIIMTSMGDRPTLQDSLRSLLPQLRPEDYITLISDANHVTVAEVFTHEPCNCTKLLIANVNPLGWWGHGSRTRWQRLLPGAFHMNADDDDLYPPNAMALIRHHVRDLSATMYVFRMVRQWDKAFAEIIPPLHVNHSAALRTGTVGTPCVVYRALRDRLPNWGTRYGGDGDFIMRLHEVMNATVIVPQVIYHVGQREDLMPFVPGLLRGEPPPHRGKATISLGVGRYLGAPRWIGEVSNQTAGVWSPTYAQDSIDRLVARIGTWV